MKTRFLLLLLLTAGVLSSHSVRGQSNLPQPLSFSFSLTDEARTSAGVFSIDGTLVRTLWSNVKFAAGNHTAKWDGTDDEGRLVANDTYTVRVLSNNVTYTWEGVVGNTSATGSGAGVYHGYERMYSMAISGNTAYCARGYNEQAPSPVKVNLANPQQKIGILSAGRSTGQNTTFVSTDGNKVYWAGNDPFNSTLSFVFASSVNNDAQTIFAAGTSYTTAWGTPYSSVIDVVKDPQSAVSGMAVQKTGSYLFVAHKALNELHVLNKTTGALVRTESMEAPQSLAVDNTNDLWVIHASNGTQIAEKFAVGADGRLSTKNIRITTLDDPLAIAVSPDNSTVVVADGAGSQQLKAFTNSSGLATWIFGRAGGYANDPQVTNDKFYFNDVSNRIRGTFVAFEDDGSFWVEDAGNSRAQHYGANRQFIETIMYLPCSRNTHVDPNNPTRVFSDYLEFKIDYTKPLSPTNNSWTLVKNWGFTVPGNWDNEFYRLKSIATLNNGRTYAVQQFQQAPYNWQVVELPPTGPLRFTGLLLNNDNTMLCPDGSLRKVSAFTEGAASALTTKALLGFDASNNPQWGAEDSLASTPAATASDPVYRGMVGWASPSTDVTSSNVFVSFEGGLKPPYGSNGYHLGGVKLGANKWLWKTARSTRMDYEGDYPGDGAYDLGNGAGYLGGLVATAGRNIFWSYHGEGWKQSQTNKWQHVHDDGLLVGTFGVTGPDVSNEEAPAEMAGNVLSGNVVADGSGNLYLYHCDESYHSGIHRWKIEGLETIKEQSIAVTVAASGQGLLGQYHEGPELNNLNTKSTRIDSVINFISASEVTTNTNLHNQQNFSVSWTGYVRALYSEEYRFYLKTIGGARLWIDGKLFVDLPAATAVNDSAQLTFIAGKQYPIRIEYYNDQGPAAVSLQWASGSQQQQIVPKGCLFPGNLPDRSKGVDLLENLPSNKSLENNRYGWRRYPATDGDSANRWTDYWQVVTGKKTYCAQSPDVHALFHRTNQTGVAVNASVTRDLGNTDKPLASWTLDGEINYDGNDPNFDSYNFDTSGQSGATLQVLDKNGKVIVQFFPHASVSGSQWTGAVYANGQTLVETDYGYLEPIIRKSQPLTIGLKNGLATFRYGPYTAITTSVQDPESDWQHPKTLRLYFWTNVPWSHNDRVIDIPSMRFLSAVDSTHQTLPLHLLSLKATLVNERGQVSWTTANETGVKSFVVEKSTDGNRFSPIGTVSAKNTTAASYFFIDSTPLVEVNFYRLKMINEDETFAYSSVVSLKAKSTAFAIIPNPVRNILVVKHPAASATGQMEILSTDGKTLKAFFVTKGSNSTFTDVSFLKTGYYLIRYKNSLFPVTLPFLKE